MGEFRREGHWGQKHVASDPEGGTGCGSALCLCTCPKCCIIGAREREACVAGCALRDVLAPAGKAVWGESGELVCTRPFPSQPTHFWMDESGSKYHKAYFSKFPGRRAGRAAPAGWAGLWVSRPPSGARRGRSQRVPPRAAGELWVAPRHLSLEV